MDFEKPQDCVDALKKLEGFPLMGMDVRDGRLVFTSLSCHVSLPLRKARYWRYKVARYGLNKLDALVDHVRYDDQLRQVILFDENGDNIAHVELKNVTRKEWRRSELLLRRERTMERLTDEKLMQRAFDLLDPLVREGWALHTVNDKADRTTLFFDNGVSAYLKRTEYFVSEYKPRGCSTPLASMQRIRKQDGSDAWKLIDEDGHAVFTVELAQPTDPLPVYVASLKEALVGSRVQSVSATDGGLCLHLDDDYDAVTNGSLRVRVDSERVPFTVGDVFVNRGGADLTLCLCAQTESKPVVAFKIDHDVLERKELSFNVI